MHSRTTKLSTRQLVAILAGAVILLGMLSLATNQRPFASSELAFTESSASGLKIVPASCESSPQYPHYPGQCAIPSGGCTGAGCTPTVPTVSVTGCTIVAGPSTIVRGSSATIAWGSRYEIFGIPYVTTGTITPVPGTVAQTGSATVSPVTTTTYSGTFSPTGDLSGISSQWLTPVTCSTQITVLDSLPTATQCTAQMFCVGADRYQQNANCSNTRIDTCPYGCSNGVCLGAGAPTAFIRVRPALIASGSTTNVEWSASLVNAASCSVTEDSADINNTWSGSASGSQTSAPIPSRVTYTLSCQALNGTSITRSATVNVVPTFDEN